MHFEFEDFCEAASSLSSTSSSVLDDDFEEELFRLIVTLLEATEDLALAFSDVLTFSALGAGGTLGLAGARFGRGFFLIFFVSGLRCERVLDGN